MEKFLQISTGHQLGVFIIADKFIKVSKGVFLKFVWYTQMPFVFDQYSDLSSMTIIGYSLEHMYGVHSAFFSINF